MAIPTDRQAFQLGKRAYYAGMEPRPGIFVLGEDPTTGIYDAGVITGFSPNDKVETSRGFLLSWGGELSPDFRDPGTKGHALAQLRDRTGNPTLVASYYAHTTIVGRPIDLQWRVDAIGGSPYPTEGEAIVAAFEATKETP